MMQLYSLWPAVFGLGTGRRPPPCNSLVHSHCARRAPDSEMHHPGSEGWAERHCERRRAGLPVFGAVLQAHLLMLVCGSRLLSGRLRSRVCSSNGRQKSSLTTHS